MNIDLETKFRLTLNVREADMLRVAARARIRKLNKDKIGLSEKEIPLDKTDMQLEILSNLITVLSGHIAKITGSSDYKLLWF